MLAGLVSAREFEARAGEVVGCRAAAGGQQILLNRSRRCKYPSIDPPPHGIGYVLLMCMMSFIRALGCIESWVFAANALATRPGIARAC